MSSTDSVWLVTGCSTGFGRELARLLLRRGRRVLVTARDPATLAEFSAAANALVATLDVTVPAQIADVVRQAGVRFGGIDVLVNNAGYGYLSAIEEGEDKEVRAIFETNVFGLANMTRAVLPGMRERRRGHIVNISSMSGLIGLPGIGYYNATKFAVEGMSEALAKEVAPLGIRVTIVEPGPFRTDWAGRSLKTPPTAIADYAPSAGARRAAVQAYSGRQPGDPVRAAEAIIEAVESPEPPLHLLLGRPAYEMTAAKLKEFSAEMEKWRELSLGADFPDAD
ncbi:MAG: SDR family NAD(P)-dependent oxidoreductase [Candidatus Accumulibacter sp.]|uniref:oxidoreductase n=1 Tax=Accumulibacter sp. TaxID=2053492 RepID=UPI0019FE79B1|nr:oxidoreductase [Accumulibacter sp.]MBE2258159.1 SDR family NAD(P)-dependent oxidoreductase [Paracoccaceae bacterium]MCB1940958.1 SDR family NAD(P)-dependent oxidoreductase [Accumulibacter sp.]MCP5249123.1 SDR family NAD(P)-dependent oxidoreductase [Accumulibacter sp.]